MTKSVFRTLTGTTAIWLGLSGIASADVTAPEVWDNWKNYVGGVGQTISIGKETNANGTLTLEDVKIAMKFPDGQMSGTFEQLEFRENGDGTVLITMSPDYPVAISSNPTVGEELDMAMIVRQVGMSAIASGTPESVSYVYDADELSISIDKMFVGGEDVAPNINFSISDIDGEYQIESGDISTIDSKMSAASGSMILEMDDPQQGAKIAMSGSFEGLSGGSSATLPLEIDLEDPGWMLGSDFGAQGNFETGPANYKMSVDDGQNSFDIAAVVANSTLDFSMLEGLMKYGGSSNGIVYEISGAQIPFPSLSLGIAETAFEFAMPMAKSDDPKDFGFVTKLVDISVSDDLWNMFDPGNILPRDPATIIVDVAGRMNWLLNLGNPEEAEAFAEQGKSPANLHAVDVNDVTFSIAGANVNGNGGFTFDNNDLVSWNGMPAPSGAIDMNIIGVNTLMDRLTQMGLLPQEQAMGARMMLGLFARPGEGADTLTSKIEVESNGSVFANGQQIK